MQTLELPEGSSKSSLISWSYSEVRSCAVGPKLRFAAQNVPVTTGLGP